METVMDAMIVILILIVEDTIYVIMVLVGIIIQVGALIPPVGGPPTKVVECVRLIIVVKPIQLDVPVTRLVLQTVVLDLLTWNVVLI
jgi:hypothetical protein